MKKILLVDFADLTSEGRDTQWNLLKSEHFNQEVRKDFLESYIVVYLEDDVQYKVLKNRTNAKIKFNIE